MSGVPEERLRALARKWRNDGFGCLDEGLCSCHESCADQLEALLTEAVPEPPMNWEPHPGQYELIAAELSRANREDGPRDDIFWPPNEGAEELLYEIRNGKTKDYVLGKAEELRELWSKGKASET
jgi:hypothetical protein